MAVKEPTWSMGRSLLYNSSGTAPEPGWSYGASNLMHEYAGGAPVVIPGEALIDVGVQVSAAAALPLSAFMETKAQSVLKMRLNVSPVIETDAHAGFSLNMPLSDIIEMEVVSQILSNMPLNVLIEVSAVGTYIGSLLLIETVSFISAITTLTALNSAVERTIDKQSVLTLLLERNSPI